MKTKKQCQSRHAKRRAYERFGLLLNRHQMHELVKQLQAGKGRFVERQSLRVSVFDLDVEGETMRVVYDRHRKVIVTFLYPNREQYEAYDGDACEVCNDIRQHDDSLDGVSHA